MRWESAVKAWGFGGCGAWGRERRHSGGIENCNGGFAEKPWLSYSVEQSGRCVTWWRRGGDFCRGGVVEWRMVSPCSM